MSLGEKFVIPSLEEMMMYIKERKEKDIASLESLIYSEHKKNMSNKAIDRSPIIWEMFNGDTEDLSLLYYQTITNKRKLPLINSVNITDGNEKKSREEKVRMESSFLSLHNVKYPLAVVTQTFFTRIEAMGFDDSSQNDLIFPDFIVLNDNEITMKNLEKLIGILDKSTKWKKMICSKNMADGGGLWLSFFSTRRHRTHENLVIYTNTKRETS